jgi:hypothetical protein
MEHLYVCQFANGHIKVGRSADPEVRVKQHAERVSCLGVELVAFDYYPCSGSVINAEARLIARCAEHASAQRKNEWFEGLQPGLVCEWAREIAGSDDEAPQVDHESPDFRAIVRGLMACGITQAQIAQRCKCDQSTISDIANGRGEPRYSMGVALLKLAAEPAQQPA